MTAVRARGKIKAEYCELLCFISGTQKSCPTLPPVCWLLVWRRAGGDCREQRVGRPSRRWGGQQEDTWPATSRWTVDTIRAAQYSVGGFGFLILNYRDGEKFWSQVAGTEGRLVAEPAWSNLAPEYACCWGWVRSGGIVAQLGSPVSKLVHYYSQMQEPPPAAAAANIQGSGAAAAVRLLHATPGQCSPHTLTATGCSVWWWESTFGQHKSQSIWFEAKYRI